MTTNGGAHKFNKNENNWLHKHFEDRCSCVFYIDRPTSPGQSECICPDSSFKGVFGQAQTVFFFYPIYTVHDGLYEDYTV